MPKFRRNTLKRKNESVNNLSKKQIKDLKQFGQLHPVDESISSIDICKKVTNHTFQQFKKKKVVDVEKVEDVSSEESGVDAYTELLSTMKAEHSSEDEETEEDDIENSMDEDDSEGESDLDQSGEEFLSDQSNVDENESDQSDELPLESDEEVEEDEGDEQEVDEEEEEGGGQVDHLEEDVLADNDEESSESDDDDGDDDNKNACSRLDECKEKDNSEINTDKCYLHFERELKDEIIDSLSEPWEKTHIKLPVIGECVSSLSKHVSSNKITLCSNNLKELNIKKRIVDTLPKTNQMLANTDSDGFTSLQRSVYSVLSEYKDFYYPERTRDNCEQLRVVYALHALNHVLSIRSRIISHNASIKAELKKDPKAQFEYRDQGLMRPKVLIVLPFRDSALRVVKILTSLLMNNKKSYLANKIRFFEEFGEDEEEKTQKKTFKNEDFEATFSGNIDDHFRIGIQVSKGGLKLFQGFYQSDIIIASPLGLRTLLGAEGEENREHDFISSIEMLIFDQTEVFMMQNWDHIHHLMSLINMQPKKSHGVDFTRVREYALNGNAKNFRQTIVFSSFKTPEINSIINKNSKNYNGSISTCNNVDAGSIAGVAISLPHVFQRFECSSRSNESDERFNYFTKNILSEFSSEFMSQTLIYVPSYFDFVRLRNYFKKKELNFISLSEYSEPKKISRSRTQFFHKKNHFLLFSERLHFYKRLKIRGARHVIFYQPPLFSSFYTDFANAVQTHSRTTSSLVSTSDASCTTLFSRYDLIRIQYLVGTERAKSFLNAESSKLMLIT